MILWLIYVELFKKDHLCQYCTFVHILTVALFIVIAFGTTFSEPVEAILDVDPELEDLGLPRK